ncbi:hypothetical protein TNCV_2679491 [Trichonephila clavipes]|nr:hypothetical protein TNCV_2679491 [Trichonephila clavipes]
MKLPLQLINTTNERRLVKGHGDETVPLRVKGDIGDVFSELDNGAKGCTWIKRPEFYCSRRVTLNKTSSTFMTTIKCVKRGNNLKCREIV